MRTGEELSIFYVIGDAEGYRKDSAPPASDIGKLKCSFIVMRLIANFAVPLYQISWRR